MLQKPCPNDAKSCGCHICKLYLHDDRYRKLWGGDGAATALVDYQPDTVPGMLITDSQRQSVSERKQRARAECLHLREPLETVASCGCAPSNVLRGCELFGKCRRFGVDPKHRICATCTDYTAPDDPTTDDWLAVLRSPTERAREPGIHLPQQTEAVKILIDELRQSMPALPNFARERGIVTSGGGKYWPSTWVTCAIIRAQGWREPIQAWYLGEAEYDEYWIDALRQLDVVCIDAREIKKKNPYRILNGFEIKLFALAHCGIQQPLWLDSDSYPARNPAFIYDCPGYRATGSVQYPDLAETNGWTKWGRWGVEPDDSPGIETGQFIHDLSRVWPEFQIALRLNEFSDLTYHWDYGDKGPTRVAWAWTRRARTIYVPVPKWIGPAFVHVGHDGEPLFIHRCRGKASIEETHYYTPQHGHGLDHHPELPAEDLFQQKLQEARILNLHRAKKLAQ